MAKSTLVKTALGKGSLYVLVPPAIIVVNHGLERMGKEVVKGQVHPITCDKGTKVE